MFDGRTVAAKVAKIAFDFFVDAEGGKLKSSNKIHPNPF